MITRCRPPLVARPTSSARSATGFSPYLAPRLRGHLAHTTARGSWSAVTRRYGYLSLPRRLETYRIKPSTRLE